MTARRHHHASDDSVWRGPAGPVLVDIHPECLGDLLRDSKAAKARVALLEFKNRLDKFG
jgi:hypothetical protein